MRKKLFFLLILLITLGVSFEVLALETTWPTSPFGTDLTDDSVLTDMVRYFYEWGIFIGGIAVFITLLIGGFLYLTSMGNPARMNEAKDRIFSALIGLVLLLCIYLILNTINPELTILTMPTFTSSEETLKKICEASLYDQNGDHIIDLEADDSWNGGTINGDTEIRRIEINTGGMYCELLLYIQKNQGGDGCTSDADCSDPTPDCEDRICCRVFTESTDPTGAAYLSAENKGARLGGKPCKETILYEKENCTEASKTIKGAHDCEDCEDWWGNPTLTVNSIRINGGCTVRLYDAAGCGADHLVMAFGDTFKDDEKCDVPEIDKRTEDIVDFSSFKVEETFSL